MFDTPSSTPPGARASTRTSPVTWMDVSCVSPANRSQTSGETCDLTTTAWSVPVPSRMTMNATLPEERTWVTHPRTAVDMPARLWRSTMREYGAVTGCVVGGGPESYEHRNPGSTPRHGGATFRQCSAPCWNPDA